MPSSIPSDLRDFVRKKVESGEFPTEDAVVEAALRRLREQDAPGIDLLVDREFVEYCNHEGDDRVSLDEVLRATASIPGSMAQAIIEEERAERF